LSKLAGWPEGIPGEPSKSKIVGQWIHSLAALAAEAFLTTRSQAQESNEKVSFIAFLIR
jgi:hypothetical protein